MFIRSIEKLSSNLKKLIAIRDISSSDLAKELDIPMATLHRIINGQTQRPKKQIVKKLAKFFNVSQDELIGEEEIEWGNKVVDRAWELGDFLWTKYDEKF